MRLKKTDVVVEIPIIAPKWVSREIYIATYKVGEHNVISFTSDSAKKQYPGQYYIAGKDVRKYPIFDMPTKNGGKIRVYQVSLDELILYEGRG